MWAATLLILFGPINIEQPHVVVFAASWCRPCQQSKPLWVKLKAEGYPIRYIDIDEHPELRVKHRVRVVPTVVVVVEGQERARFTGVKAEPALRQWLERYGIARPKVPEPSGPLGRWPCLGRR